MRVDKKVIGIVVSLLGVLLIGGVVISKNSTNNKLNDFATYVEKYKEDINKNYVVENEEDYSELLDKAKTIIDNKDLGNIQSIKDQLEKFKLTLINKKDLKKFDDFSDDDILRIINSAVETVSNIYRARDINDFLELDGRRAYRIIEPYETPERRKKDMDEYFQYSDHLSVISNETNNAPFESLIKKDDKFYFISHELRVHYQQKYDSIIEKVIYEDSMFVTFNARWIEEKRELTYKFVIENNKLKLSSGFFYRSDLKYVYELDEYKEVSIQLKEEDVEFAILNDEFDKAEELLKELEKQEYKNEKKIESLKRFLEDRKKLYEEEKEKEKEIIAGFTINQEEYLNIWFSQEIYDNRNKEELVKEYINIHNELRKNHNINSVQEYFDFICTNQNQKYSEFTYINLPRNTEIQPTYIIDDKPIYIYNVQFPAVRNTISLDSEGKIWYSGSLIEKYELGELYTIKDGKKIKIIEQPKFGNNHV